MLVLATIRYKSLIFFSRKPSVSMASSTGSRAKGLCKIGQSSTVFDKIPSAFLDKPVIVLKLLFYLNFLNDSVMTFYFVLKYSSQILTICTNVLFQKFDYIESKNNSESFDINNLFPLNESDKRNKFSIR